MRSSFWVVLLVALALVVTAPATVIWELVPVTTPLENVAMTVTVTDIGSSQIQFDLAIDPTLDPGDITGLFFNVKDGITGITNGMFSGTDLALVCLAATGTLECREDNNLSGVAGLPAGSFQVGMAFGTQGDDGIMTTTVIFNYALTGRTFAELDFAPVAGRIKSIGLDGEGSAKLLDLVPTVEDVVDPVPEPSSWLFLGAGLGLIAIAKIRRMRRG
jgi:hypothetical protein